jgi:ribosomal protein S27E
MSQDPEDSFDVEQDSQGRAVVVLTCPGCEHKTRRLMSEVSPNTTIACPDCGEAEWTFTGGDLAALGRAFDGLGG